MDNKGKVIISVLGGVPDVIAASEGIDVEILDYDHEPTPREVTSEEAAEVAGMSVRRRRRLPKDRQALTHHFEVGGHDGYLTIGLYEDGMPGELFLKIAKSGSTLSGFADGWSLVMSLALQYGVPLKVLVEKFRHHRFEPQGMTASEEIPEVTSILDYVVRYLELKFIKPQETPDD